MSKKSTIITLAFIFLFNLLNAQQKLPIPTNAQLTWQNAELVAVFHYDLHVFDNKAYTQKINRVTPINDYNIFNPTKLDTDQWILAAKQAGVKIAILTATHETGFALYQSNVNPYSLKAVNWRNGQGDLVKDFVTSCKKYGVKPGIYIGIRWNSNYGVHDFKVEGTSEFAQNRQKQYNKMCEGMVEELMTNYGDLAIVWFDGGAHGPELGGPDILSKVEEHQKDIIFYHNTQRADIRWGGSETGTVPYPSWGTYPFEYSHSINQEVIFKDNFKLLKEGDPNGNYYMPAMSDFPFRGYNGRHEWFWEPNDDDHVFPLKNLMEMYYKSVGHNSSLIIGLTPDPDGLLPETDVNRLKEWGQEIKKRFANPIATTYGDSKTIKLNLNERNLIKEILIMEDITKGERVREFILEGETENGWKEIFKGSCIGHKFIHRLEPLEVTSVRLKVTQSIGTPQIKQFSVY